MNTFSGIRSSRIGSPFKETHTHIHLCINVESHKYKELFENSLQSERSIVIEILLLDLSIMGTKLFLHWLLNLHEWEETGNIYCGGFVFVRKLGFNILIVRASLHCFLLIFCRYKRFVRIPRSHTESTSDNRRPTGRRIS